MESNGGDCATARGDLLDSKSKKVAADKTANDLNATGDKYNADALVLPRLTTKQCHRVMLSYDGVETSRLSLPRSDRKMKCVSDSSLKGGLECALVPGRTAPVARAEWVLASDDGSVRGCFRC